MASRFAALAEDEEASESSQDEIDVVAHDVQPDSARHPEDQDDAGYLDAFYHNNKAARHIGAAAARRTANAQNAAARRAAEGKEEAAAASEVQLEEQKSDGDEHEEEEDCDQSGSRLKHVSKKAKRKAARKHAKAEKAVKKQSGEVEEDREEAEHAEAAAAADEPERDDDADDDEGVKERRLSKAEQKRRKELERQLRKGERREAERLESEQLAKEMGGILDARYRRRVMKCPDSIAPVSGEPHVWEIALGFVPDMQAPARFFADERLAMLCLEEVSAAGGGFLPAVRQLANVATLPGLMGFSLGMPDIHSGYGFAVGSVAAIDLTKPEAVVSPGGVGFDINCGVRLLRTELKEEEIKGKKCAELASAIFEAVPSGVGAGGAYFPKGEQELKCVLRHGMGWALERKYCWPEDLERTEEKGCMPDADPSAVSSRAMKRGSPQLGTLGSGNHYLELQVVDEIFDTEAAAAMGLQQGHVCVMIHCGSRGLGHQLCTDYLQSMEIAMRKQGISVPDRQLCCVRASSPAGEEYLRGMAAAANYAFVNRTLIAHSVRQVFQKLLGRDAKADLKMHMVYDVAHNIAKKEEHIDPADGQVKATLVHRKGATRSFPPGHAALPEVYRVVGQPVLIGGSMGTCSYVLAGTHKAMELSFGSTCHGAGRQMSRAASLRSISSQAVLAKLRKQQVEVRVASPKLVAEEADESYKDVTSVVRTCHEVGISRMVARLRPIAVIKG